MPNLLKSDEFISSIPEMRQRDRVEEKRDRQSKRGTDKVRVHFIVHVQGENVSLLCVCVCVRARACV